MDPRRDQELSALLRLAQGGDRLAYERFLREAAVVLRAFLAKRIPGPAAEDVLQETLLSIHRSRHTYLPDRPLGPWLYAIGENRALDHFRRARAETRRRNALGREPREMPAESEAQFDVLGALRKLPGIQKKVIEMLKVQDQSVREVSGRLNMSESSVKVTAHRGYEAMRKILGVKK